jgi:ribose/xylose/arabinose/galactoside ABC-type transport system permease subunit
VVAGAVLGGIDFIGGRGSLLAAVGAVLILQVLDTMLVGLGLSYEARLAAMGLIILLRSLPPAFTKPPAAAARP